MAETRALLLTDVVDSTALAERLGDAAMAALWARHDRVARDLLPVHHGREIDKTDGFLMLFWAASDAVSYALAYHRAIAALGLKARAGLHVGPVILTENPAADVARGAKPLEVDGLAKPTAARVMGLATGGQTLLTAEAKVALGTTTLRVESHGSWRMKGVPEPVELFEVGGPDAPFTPPPDAAKVYRVVRQGDLWLPVHQVKHNLPTERDAFVGRQADLHELAARLDEGAHLVSVLGIGGTGKTRLVTRFAWTWLGDWPGGAWFCDLSEARDVEGITYAVARALDVPLGKDDPVTQLGHAIASRGRCLVILDNFEQVARHAPQVVGRWLDRASEARFVVTTREVLGLPGESALALAPLGAGDAVELFVARAVQAKRDFALGDGEPPAVTELVRLLDALPLAIELAAARVRVMPPRMLLQRMSERFKLLSSSGGRHTRQATLRAALDWSWDLLAPDEQQALAQLSVFEGGFTLEAAEAVLSLSEAWPMDAVQALVDKSLVRRVAEDRFDLLVSVQEYGAERLVALGGAGPVEARHGDHFAAWGTTAALDRLDTHGGSERRRALHQELDNLVSACRRATARGDGPTAAASLRAAWAVLAVRGPLGLGVQLAELVAAMDGLSPGDRCAVASVHGWALVLAGRLADGAPQLEAALQLATAHPESVDRRPPEAALRAWLARVPTQLGRLAEATEILEGALRGPGAPADRPGDRNALARVLLDLGGLVGLQGKPAEAIARVEAALAVFRELGNRVGEGWALRTLGVEFYEVGRLEESLAAYQGALSASRETLDRLGEAMTLGNLGNLYSAMGRPLPAFEHYQAASALYRELGHRTGEGALVGDLGGWYLDQGRLDEAREHLEAALAVNREVGHRRFEGLVLSKLGLVHQRRGELDQAEAYHRNALSVRAEAGDRRGQGIVLGYLGALSSLRERWDEAIADYEAALAVHRAVRNVVGEGQVLGAIARVRGMQGRAAEAEAGFATSEDILRANEAPDLLALVLCARAVFEHRRGRTEAARTALIEAEALAVAVGAAPAGEIVAELGRVRAELGVS